MVKVKNIKENLHFKTINDIEFFGEICYSNK